MNSEIKVFIVDDNNLEIDLLQQMFQNHDRLRYFGKAKSGEECLKHHKVFKQPPKTGHTFFARYFSVRKVQFILY